MSKEGFWRGIWRWLSTGTDNYVFGVEPPPMTKADCRELMSELKKQELALQDILRSVRR